MHSRPPGSFSGRIDRAATNLPLTPPSQVTDTIPPSLFLHHQTGNQTVQAADNNINLEHMELLLHSIKATNLFSLGGDRKSHEESLTSTEIIDLGVRFPYLLHELCAFSARHLATLHPAKAEHYLNHAITLQTCAVSLFNTSYTHMTQESCVPTLLFATTLGHHVFTDTLCSRRANDISSFLLHFTQCLDTLKGVYVIFQEARPFWAKSVLADILAKSSSLTSRVPIGTRCQRIKKLVEVSPNLISEEKEACHEAIRFLQVGFDALLAEREEPGNRHQMLFLWCILMRREFIALLSKKNKEALIILGYYATLLKYGRAMWQVEDAGEYMFELIRVYLDGKIEWNWE